MAAASNDMTAFGYLQKVKRIARTSRSMKHKMRERETPGEAIHRLNSALRIIVETCEEYEDLIGKGEEK